jgi:hypothetical protein
MAAVDSSTLSGSSPPHCKRSHPNVGDVSIGRHWLGSSKPHFKLTASIDRLKS